MDVSYFWNGVNIALAKRNLSESWLCKETGLSLRTMKNRIKKGIQPRLDEAVRITDALGMTLDSLCDGSGAASVSKYRIDLCDIIHARKLTSTGNGSI